MSTSLKKKSSTSPPSNNGLKQGTLFSFFSKKPATSSSTTATTNPTANVSNPNNHKQLNKNNTSSSSVKDISNPSKQSKTAKTNNGKEKLLSQLKVGSSISVYWPDDNEYYNAKISSRHFNKNNNGMDDHVYTLVYEDGDIEKNINLRNEDFKLLDNDIIVRNHGHDHDSSIISQEEDEEAGTSADDDDDEGPVRGKRFGRSYRKQEVKKRKIIEESDEEAEFDDDDDDNDDGQSDVSEFIAGSEDEEDDEEEASMEMTEDEEDDEDDENGFDDYDDDEDIATKPSSKRKPKHLRVTQLDDKGMSTGKRSSSFITPPPKKKKHNQTVSNRTNSFASFASSKKSSEPNGSNNDLEPRGVTPLSHLTRKSPLSTSPRSASKPTKIPMPLPGVVNQAGTHFHNHYTFLQPHKRCDGNNRPISHPEYNPRTLKVDYREIERVSKKLTPAQEQWWNIKAQYADTILLFKTGKFYEIFHMDADIAVQVLNFVYMKGQDAHAGFPEIAYGGFCEKLVKAGYKVARVEQTETPEMLNERKKKARVGNKPKVVNREVCSIVTAGTRTFCYMDDVSCLAEYSGATNIGIGPLLSIKETLIPSSNSETDEVQPICEYGITIIDAATGTVTMGQFADDVLRSRMNTLLTKYSPSEILVENGPHGASETLLSLINGAKNSFLPKCQVEKVNPTESFPRSTAVDVSIREKMERLTNEVKPWNNDETLQELHRRAYFPRASRKHIDTDSNPENGISRWPQVLKACIEGGAELAISSLGAALFYLQRNLIDQEILSMGVIKGYIPPEPVKSTKQHGDQTNLRQIIANEERMEDGVVCSKEQESRIQFPSIEHSTDDEGLIDHLSLDGTTIANLEILTNSHSNTVAGSLWSKINFAKSPFGCRLLRAWLLRPLFRKSDIDRRADAVEELTSGSAAAAMSEARDVLSKCGDMERLLSRVHSMGFVGTTEETSHHPNERAILYEAATHTKRKVGDFSKLLDGLSAISRIPEIFEDVDIRSPLLGRIVRTQAKGGLFPSNLQEELDWFNKNFDCRKAAEGNYEPARGVNEDYDAACDEIDRIKSQLEDYKRDMCQEFLSPRNLAKAQWKYVNTKVDSKDKYLIELPINIQVPGDFIVKGKRGKGPKQINKYSTPVVEQLVNELEHAYDVMKAGKARGIQMIFAKFDSLRSLWSSASNASAMLDALGALAQASSTGGYCRPEIRNCFNEAQPSIIVKQGRHPCVDFTHNGGDFIPNDITLGGTDDDGDGSRVLLLSGPNMGGKSTLLRQTCLIAILAQIGCFVPAELCILTPFDRIFTRLGASDRILLGQSTFFVELAETAAALRGASRRSLCIFDELGRGTSTFDGTAIASATVKHLVEKNKCLSLFATHYHSLLEDWSNHPLVRLGHMECFVEDDKEEDAHRTSEMESKSDNITFLYTLGEGSCPRSFGINVARLAGLPNDVLKKAKNVSNHFEETLNKQKEYNATVSMTSLQLLSIKKRLLDACEQEDSEEMTNIWKELQL